MLLSLLPTSPAAAAAPAPDTAAAAKAKLEALRKELPGLLDDWAKKPGNATWLMDKSTCRPELRLLRRVAPDRAKMVVVFAAFDAAGGRAEGQNLVLTAFLSFQDGCWTSERFEATRYRLEVVRVAHMDLTLLLLEVDEAAEK
jgi:hypothetical protein